MKSDHIHKVLPEVICPPELATTISHQPKGLTGKRKQNIAQYPFGSDWRQKIPSLDERIQDPFGVIGGRTFFKW